MNNKRLSKEGKLSVDRTFLHFDKEKFLGMPYYYEIKDGDSFLFKSLNKYHQRRENIKVSLKYPNGLIFSTFDSMSSCARFIGVCTLTVRSRIKTKKPVLFENKQLYIYLVVQ